MGSRRIADPALVIEARLDFDVRRLELIRFRDAVDADFSTSFESAGVMAVLPTSFTLGRLPF